MPKIARNIAEIAIGIMCKTPMAGRSKTRLSPPLSAEQCAEISAAFIGDLSATIANLAEDEAIAPFAVYTPIGSELILTPLLPTCFRLLSQAEGDLGARLLAATGDLLRQGSTGVILVNSDSPTLPPAILKDAVAKLRAPGDRLVLGPASDGGYVLIGLKHPHAALFRDIPWSTAAVYELTCARAAEIGLPVERTVSWYDVDDAATLHVLQAELAGIPPAFASGQVGTKAPKTAAALERFQLVPAE